MDKTWALWKSTSLESHKVLQRKIQACGGADQFVSTNDASVATKPSNPPTNITHEILNKMDDYMDNMANVVINEKAVIEQLLGTNSKQASTIATQSTNILSLSDEVKKIQLRITKKGRSSGRGGNSDNVRK